MLLQLKSFLNILLLLLISADKVHPFEYDDKDTWYKEYRTCGGDMQSPINLLPTKSINLPRVPEIKFINFENNLPKPINLKNNGHTVVIKSEFPNKSLIPAISGGNLPNGTFLFEQMHFHWGKNDKRGSEHTINGSAYSAELHMVFYNAKYGSVGNGRNYTDGLAVIGLFFKLNMLPNSYRNKIELLLKNLQYIKKSNSDINISNINIRLFNILNGINLNKYFTYQGSLTTPPCSEAVTWMVFTDYLCISSSTMRKFRKLYNDKGEILVDNYRNIQPVGNRNVFYIDY